MTGVICAARVPDAWVLSAQGGQIRRKTSGLMRNTAAARRLHLWLAPQLREWIDRSEILIGKRSLIGHLLRPVLDRMLISLSHLPKGEKLCVRFLNLASRAGLVM